MRPDLLLVGGEDHDLRIPFLLALRNAGLRIAASGTGSPLPFAAAGIQFFPLRFDRFVNPMADRAAIAKLASVLSEARPRLAQCFDTKPNLLVPLAARRVADVSVIRTINGLGWMFSVGTPLAVALRPVFRVLHRVAARSTTATVFQNREDRAYFERHRMLGRGAVHLIPGSGIDIARFEREAATGPTPATLRAELGLGKAPVVMTVARLTRQKGIPTLLEAAARVHAVRPDVRFVLVGGWDSEGPLAVTEAEVAAHRPYVVTTGKRADVPALLRAADVFAFPTEYREGIPRALMEAGLAGLPLIATRMPGCTDVISDGETGRLVRPRDAPALAASILGMLAAPQSGRAMGRRASALVRAEFGLELTVARYARVYSAVLNRGAAADPFNGALPAHSGATAC